MSLDAAGKGGAGVRVKDAMKLARVSVVLLASFALAGCTSDDEKIMRVEEDLARIVDQDKDDCDRMAADIAKLGDEKGKDVQKLKAKMIQAAGGQAKLEARLNEKFADRRKATLGRLRGGMRCLLSEQVATAMLKVEGDGQDQPDRKPPEKPASGAPVAFVVDKVDGKTLDVSAYNFGDKTFASYELLLRFYAADGTVLRPRTALGDRDFMNWSIMGKAYRVPPKQWRSFQLNIDMPSGTAKSDVRVVGVTAVVNNGVKMEEQPTWRISAFDWPDARASK